MNTSKLSVVALIAASFWVSACGEQVLPTQQSTDATHHLEVPAAAHHALSVGAQTPPASAPPAYQHYTSLIVGVDVGWLDAHTAYGQATNQYSGNNATVDVDLSVRNASGTIVGSNSGHASDSYVFPGDHTLRASTTVYVTATCGLVAQATANGSVFDSFFTTTQGTLTWGRKSDSDTKSAAQPACAPPPTCQDGTATNYGAPLPCTYPPPPPSGTGTSPTSGTGYPGETYMPPIYVPGYWNCTIWNYGTPYVIQNCVWVPGYYKNLLPTSPASLARLVAPGTSSRTQSGAELPSVFVIVSDQVPADAIAVIERHKTGPLKNVLLVPSANVRPAVFVALMQALYDSRAKDGDAPAKELSLVLRGSILDQQFASADRDYAASFTALIASAKKGDAAGYGNLPIVEFKLGEKK